MNTATEHEETCSSFQEIIDAWTEARRIIASSSDEECTIFTKTAGKNTSSIPGHLASPIYGEECQILYQFKNEKFYCARHINILYFITKVINVEGTYEVFDDPIGVIQTWLAEECPTRDQPSVLLYKLSTSHFNWGLHFKNFLKPASNSLIPERQIDEFVNEKSELIRKEVLTLLKPFADMKRVENFKDEVCFKDIPMGQLHQWNGSYFERDISVLRVKGKYYLFPTSMVLCAADKLQSKFGLYLYWKVSDCMDKYKNTSIFDRGTELYEKFVSLRKKTGQDFFTIMGTWEPLVIGNTIAREDDLGCQSLWETQFEEMRSLLAKHNVPSSEFKITDILPRNTSTEETLMTLELIGMQKSFGYPTLDSSKLLDQLKEYGTEDRFEVNPTTLMEVEGVMRRDFLSNYFIRHKKYPKLTHTPKDWYRKFFRKNKHFPKANLTQYEMWSKIRFAKCFDFDYCPDMSELIKDSAAAVTLDSWGTMYDRCMFKILYNKSPPPSFYEKSEQQTRVVAAYLQADEDHIRKLINDRERGRYSKQDMIAVQCGKECELKTCSGRAFTKQTANQRLIQTAMEHNISTKVFQYVPEQSMVDGELRVATRILSHVKEMEGLSEFVCLDLKKWCLHQRHKTTVFAARFYDEIFGLNCVFENSHNFFLQSSIFCNSRLSPPNYDDNGNPIPGPFYMNNLIGGLEGLQQKKWTHVAICLIKLAGEKADLKMTIMGQGDNQVVILHFNRSEKAHSVQLRTDFLARLDVLFKDINHELKEKETWFSQNLHEYGKQRVYKGCSVSDGTKKASKMIPDINDGLFSIPSSMSTINTITESIARVDYFPDSAFIVNQIVMANYMFRKEIITLNDNQDLVHAALFFPADFGGSPLSTLFSHSVRGHDDKVTLWLSLLKTAKDYNPRVFRNCRRIWQITPFLDSDQVVSLRRLMEDPYCLNISSLPSAENKIRDLTRKFLHSPEVTNPVIRRLYDSDVSIGEEDLVDWLSTMTPFFPQLANVLLTNSNPGIILRLQQKLTASKTIEKMVKEDRNISLIEFISEKNQQFLREIRRRFDRNNSRVFDEYIDISKCSVDIADKLRALSWRDDIIGVTKPIFQDQVRLYSHDNKNAAISNSIRIDLSNNLLSNPKSGTREFGPKKPYIGGSTQEKLKKATVDVKDKTSFVRALLELGKNKSWMQLLNCPSVVKLIDVLMKEKLTIVDLPDDAVTMDDLCAEVKSGNIFHRFQSNVDHSSAMINGLATVSSHFSQSSNYLAHSTTLGQDYSIFYQMLYVCNVAALNRLCYFEGFEHLPSYLAEFHCSSCTRLLPDVTITVEERPNYTIDSDPVKVLPQKSTPSSLSINDIATRMAYTVGCSLARNIDENFLIFHMNKPESEKLMNVKKDKVSKNDLRNLDLEYIFDVMVFMSNHGQELLLGCKNEGLRSLTSDKSFTYFAELIMDGSLLEDFLEFFNYEVIEHTTLTRYEKFSSHISKWILTHYTKNLDSTERKMKAVFSHRYQNDTHNPTLIRGLKMLSNFLFNYGALTPEQAKKIHMNLSSNSVNIHLAKKLLNITTIHHSGSQADSITLWRSMDPLDRAKSKPEVRLYRRGALLLPRTTPPIDEIEAYHSARSQSPGDIFIPEVSFIPRVLGRISSAVNKYLEILMTLGLVSHLMSLNELMIYCLAEGSGGNLATLLRLFPTAKGVYNTLIRTDIDNRETITYCDPPACTSAGVSNRLVTTYLATGETDITTPVFKRKLNETMDEFPPTLVTMDAECMVEGTNLNHVRNLIPLICSKKPEIIIFKMFWMKDLDEHVRKVCPAGYNILMMKPITSNPCGKECFLVLTEGQIEILNRRPLERSLAHWKSVMEQNSSFTPGTLTKYLAVAEKVRYSLKSMDPTQSMSIHSRYYMPLSQVCGLYCKNFLSELLEALDTVHNSTDNTQAHMAIRDCGTNELIKKLMQDILFITMVKSTERRNQNQSNYISGMIIAFGAYKVDYERIGDYRSNKVNSCITIRLDGEALNNPFKEWADAKMFLRSLYDPPCCCEPIILYIDKDRKHELLSRKYLGLLSEFGMNKGTRFFYELRRIRPNEELTDKRQFVKVGLHYKKI